MKNSGSSSVETMVYISVLVLMFGVFASAAFSVSKSYARLSNARGLDMAAIAGMERMVRTIRASSNVDVAGSVFSSAAGVLSLDQNIGGVNSNTVFRLVGQNVQVEIDGVSQGVLLPSGVAATSMVFNLVDSGLSQAVKVEVTLSGQKYHTTAILRRSYK